MTYQLAEIYSSRVKQLPQKIVDYEEAFKFAQHILMYNPNVKSILLYSPKPSSIIVKRTSRMPWTKNKKS